MCGRISIIQECAHNIPWFDISVVNVITDWCSRHDMTDRQSAALYSIIQGWKINTFSKSSTVDKAKLFLKRNLR